MVTGQSGLIGFIMGSVGNPFYPELLEELVRRAEQRSRRIMVLHAGAEPFGKSTIETLVHYQMDGCIIASAELNSRAAEICQRFRVPVVMLNRVPRTHSCAVSCDNRNGAQVLMELLLAAGHKRIVIVGGSPNTSISIDRQRGAEEALSRHGVTPAAQVDGQSTYEGAVAAVETILSQRTRPDAIYAVNDIMAMAVLDTLEARGISVPHDISVIGFDDIQSAAWPCYSLTTIAQPIDAMVTRALELLEARIANSEIPAETIYLSGKLQIRSSCRLPNDLRPFQSFT